MGARRAPAPSSPQLCSGQKPTPRPRPIILRTTDGLSLSKAIVGRNPSLAHCDRQRLLMLREPASMMKPLFCIWTSEIASPRPLAKASLAAMSRSSPPGLSPFPGLSRKPESGSLISRSARSSVSSPFVVGTASMMRSLNRRAPFASGVFPVCMRTSMSHGSILLVVSLLTI